MPESATLTPGLSASRQRVLGKFGYKRPGRKQQGQKGSNMEPAELLKTVGTLAKQGLTQKQIAIELGFKIPFTLNSRLVKASQASGKPVPAFRPPRKDKLAKRVETIEVKKRGRGEAFGLNIPQEPLARVGVKPGRQFSIKVSKGRVVLTVQ